MRVFPVKGYPALFPESFRVGKWNTCNACTEPPGIDAQDQPSLPVVGIILTVEQAGDSLDLLIQEGIHDADPGRKRTLEFQTAVEFENLIGKTHTAVMMVSMPKVDRNQHSAGKIKLLNASRLPIRIDAIPKNNNPDYLTTVTVPKVSPLNPLFSPTFLPFHTDPSLKTAEAFHI